MENKKYTIGIDVVLFIIFLILKLDGIIDWKWIWIFSPFWIVWIIQLCIAVVAAIVHRERKYKPPVVSGDPLVWDAKTNTLYGPWDTEANETENEE